MEQLDSDSLGLFLEGHLDKDVVTLLKDQKVTGKDFLTLTEEDLKLFAFPLGYILAVKRVRKKIESGEIEFVAKDKTPEEGRFDVESDILEERSEKSVRSEDDQLLLQYLSPEQVDDLSDYEKGNLVSRVRRHNMLSAAGFSTSSNPLQGYSVLRKTHKENKQPNVAATSTCQPPRSSTRLQMLQNPVQVQQVIQQQSKQGVLRERQWEALQGEDDSDDTQDEDTNDNGLEGADFKPEHLPKSAEALRGIKPHLASFDVETIISEDDKSKLFLPALKAGYVIKPKHRKRVFRLLMKHLSWTFVKHPNDVTVEMREGMAKSFCCTYPQYQKTMEVTGKSPWSHIFDPKKNSGHIGNIMKRIQVGLPQKDRMRKGPSKIDNQHQLSSSHDINIESLAILYPYNSNKDEILHGMEHSFQLRVQDRRKGLSVTEMINKYPHLLSYNGELIYTEFRRMHPNAKDMCLAFMKLMPSILTKLKETRINPVCKNDTIKACMLLACSLPHVIGEVSNEATSEVACLPKQKNLIEVVKTGTDIQEFINEKREAAALHRETVQPYLIGVQGLVSSNILKLFVVLDSQALDLGAVSVIQGIDWLFKSCVVFNVHFPASWNNFFRFLQTLCYELFFDGVDDVPPSCLEVFNFLTN